MRKTLTIKFMNNESRSDRLMVLHAARTIIKLSSENKIFSSHYRLRNWSAMDEYYFRIRASLKYFDALKEESRDGAQLLRAAHHKNRSITHIPPNMIMV